MSQDASPLSTACQRLASHATGWLENPDCVDSRCLNEVTEIVARAVAIFEVRPLAKIPGPKCWGNGVSRLLLGMMGAGGEGASPVATSRREGEPPSQRHQLDFRTFGEFAAASELIDLFSSHQKTGMLEIESSSGMFVLEFELGHIVHAQHDRTPEGERMGDILVAQGAIDRETMERARKNSVGGRVGEVLIGQGLVNNETLLAGLRTQIQLLFNRIFEASILSATFWGGPPIHAEKTMCLNATALLLEGARASDEKSRTSEINP
jgi:hypothetical protein